MKTSAKSILFSGILAIIATGSMFAQTTNSGFEARYRAKFGRPSPTEQARLNAQAVNAASPQAALAVNAVAANNGGFEARYRAKVGRPSPTEEARLNSEQGNSVVAGAAKPAVAVAIVGGSEQSGQARVDPAAKGEDLSKDQLNALIASAKTPAEHERIAKYYQSQAQHYLALQKEHETMLAGYKSGPGLANNKNQASTTNHCSYLVQEFSALAAKSNELAESHERMAANATKM